MVGTDNGIYIGTGGYCTVGGILLWYLFHVFPIGQLFGGTSGNGGVVSDAGLFYHLLVDRITTVVGGCTGLGGRNDEPIA